MCVRAVVAKRITGWKPVPRWRNLMAEPSQPILVLCKDLLFTSRITAEGRAARIACLVVRDLDKLAEQSGSKLILDLNLPGAIEAASTWQKTHPEAQTIGFVSRVDTETIRIAREAGIGLVLPRSQFVVKLAEILGTSGLD